MRVLLEKDSLHACIVLVKVLLSLISSYWVRHPDENSQLCGTRNTNIFWLSSNEI